METVESSVIVESPVAPVYERWERMEDFPDFMEGLTEVKRIDGRQFSWEWELGGHCAQSVSEITLQIPHQRIAWRSLSGMENSGVVIFHEMTPGQTQVTLQMKYAPYGAWDNAQAVTARIQRNLEQFKALMETSIVGEIVDKNARGF